VRERENALVVDDEEHWRRIYEANIREVGIESVRTARSLAEAEQAIDAMRFATAVIDIGLDTSDETNVDGLSVMAKLRALRDETSIIVITGRSGPDVIEFVSQSIQTYGATATFAKGKLDSGLLQDAVKSALRAYKKNSAHQRVPVYTSLHHEVDQMVWDHSMMQVLGTRGGAGAFYDFLERLLRGYVPLISSRDSKAIGTELADGVAHGAFWSRGIGKALVVSLGQKSAVEQAEMRAASDGRLHEQYSIGEMLNEYTMGRSRGVVHALIGRNRADFDGVS
jgi:ActR/RegA family two-component response regulator